MAEDAEAWPGTGGLFVDPEGCGGPRRMWPKGGRRLTFERGEAGFRILRRLGDWRERG